MKIDEARELVATKKGYGNWVSFCHHSSPINVESAEVEALDVFKSYWIEHGMSISLDIVKSANRLYAGDGICESDKDGQYINREFLIDDFEEAIAKLKESNHP